FRPFAFARITDIAMNQTLAVAYRKQIRSEITSLFAETGKPRTWRGVPGRKWGNQRTAGAKTKQSESRAPESIAAISQTLNWGCAAILTTRPSLSGSGCFVNRRKEHGQLEPSQCRTLEHAWHQAAKDGFPLNVKIAIRPSEDLTPEAHVALV